MKNWLKTIKSEANRIFGGNLDDNASESDVANFLEEQTPISELSSASDSDAIIAMEERLMSAIDLKFQEMSIDKVDPNSPEVFTQESFDENIKIVNKAVKDNTDLITNNHIVAIDAINKVKTSKTVSTSTNTQVNIGNEPHNNDKTDEISLNMKDLLQDSTVSGLFTDA